MISISEWMEQPLPQISSTDYWTKVLENHQTAWAVIHVEGKQTTIFFFHDEAGIYDRLECDSEQAAIAGLLKNGFTMDASGFLNADNPPPGLLMWSCPHDAYSSGEYWKF